MVQAPTAWAFAAVMAVHLAAALAVPHQLALCRKAALRQQMPLPAVAEALEALIVLFRVPAAALACRLPRCLRARRK